MERPKNVWGWCPHFDHPSSRCYLSEHYMDKSAQEAYCSSNERCKTCGNYEAWVSGRNYNGK